MPYSTEVIDGGKGILHVGRDTVSGEDLLISANHVLNMVKEGLSPTYALADLSEVVELSISAEEIMLNASINTEISKYVPRVIVAIVAPQDHVYGIARMWEAYAEETGWATRVFRNKSEALEWINDTHIGEHRKNQR